MLEMRSDFFHIYRVVLSLQSSPYETKYIYKHGLYSQAIKTIFACTSIYVNRANIVKKSSETTAK